VRDIQINPTYPYTNIKPSVFLRANENSQQVRKVSPVRLANQDAQGPMENRHSLGFPDRLVMPATEAYVDPKVI
jgi:hypothetical protein